jgi:hypothetical protein
MGILDEIAATYPILTSVISILLSPIFMFWASKLYEARSRYAYQGWVDTGGLEGTGETTRYRPRGQFFGLVGAALIIISIGCVIFALHTLTLYTEPIRITAHQLVLWGQIIGGIFALGLAILFVKWIIEVILDEPNEDK